MDQFIKVYDRVIDKDFANQLIAMFEESPEHHEEIVLKGHRSFTQITLQKHIEWQPFWQTLQNRFVEYIDKYMKDCNVTDKMFPQQYAFEQFRMKPYSPRVRFIAFDILSSFNGGSELCLTH